VPQPFTVIATQNPTGAAGTQLLPDSQMDRFMIRLTMGYPGPADEMQMVLQRRQGNPLDGLEGILTLQQVLQLQDAVENTYIAEPVIRYAVDLVGATRTHPLILRGGSPRATLAVVALSKSIARLRGRDFVVPEDVQEVFPLVLAHRLLLSGDARAQQRSADSVLAEILAYVPCPRLK
jgi:MoxR-like ATPase